MWAFVLHHISSPIIRHVSRSDFWENYRCFISSSQYSRIRSTTSSFSFFGIYYIHRYDHHHLIFQEIEFYMMIIRGLNARFEWERWEAWRRVGKIIRTIILISDYIGELTRMSYDYQIMIYWIIESRSDQHFSKIWISTDGWFWKKIQRDSEIFCSYFQSERMTISMRPLFSHSYRISKESNFDSREVYHKKLKKLFLFLDRSMI